jgi:hypothetical protein
MDSRNDKNLWKYTDSTNSSYYNQPTYGPFRRDLFATASFVLGLSALVMICTGIMPFPLGSLSILFGAFSYRKGKPISQLVLFGVAASVVGMICAIPLLVSAYIYIQKLQG